MAAHATAPSDAAAASAALVDDDQAGLEDAGLERGIARLMPPAMMIAIALLGVIWWMAAQPPPGPGWNDPNGPQGQPRPPGQGPMPPVQQAPPPQSSFCAGCASFNCGDCVTSIDCADCIDCGDCLSGMDCSVCSVAGSNAALAPNAPRSAGGKGLGTGRTCLVGWRRLAGSSGLLLPLVVLMGWRRRLRGGAATLSRRSTSTP